MKSDSIPRLRIFAGPNGSGKSTIKAVVPDHLLGVYVNPDEIQKGLESSTEFDFCRFGIEITVDELRTFISISTLSKKVGFDRQIESFLVVRNQLRVAPSILTPYLAAVIAAFIRERLLAERQSFTFETVMSSPDKVEVLRQGRSLGYRTYLYFIATEDPEINVSRVKRRVELGGHDVPKIKIVERYYRSLNLLLDAIRETDRAYVFDNSGNKQIWIAEITGGTEIEIKCDELPSWFKTTIWDNLGNDQT